MSLLARLFPNFLRSTSMGVNAPNTSLVSAVSAMLPAARAAESAAAGTSFFGQTIRTMIRIHFPRPSERKRIKRHGYKKRMSTPAGRQVLMRRMLKGRFVISH